MCNADITTTYESFTAWAHKSKKKYSTKLKNNFTSCRHNGLKWCSCRKTTFWWCTLMLTSTYKLEQLFRFYMHVKMNKSTIELATICFLNTCIYRGIRLGSRFLKCFNWTLKIFTCVKLTKRRTILMSDT